MPRVNPKMIELARESRGKSQTELSKEIGVRQSFLSRIESGDYPNIQHDYVQLIADKLNYPIDFFYQDSPIYPPNIHYRKRIVLDQKTLKKADALMNIYRFNIQEMLKSIDLSTQNIPFVRDQYETPEKVAEFLRSYWKVPRGPIVDLSKLIEDNGIIVIQMDFETEKIDGRSVVADTGHPIIFINKNSSGDRQRLTLAHELGHIIMHLNTIPTLGRDEEDEAFRFAGEFLMPYDEVRHEFSGRISIERLADLKRIWRISMQSILKRMQTVGAIDSNKARYIWSQFSSMGIRKREPIEIPQEKPTLATKMVDLLMSELDYTADDLSRIFKINKDEVNERFLKKQEAKLRLA